MLFARSAGSAQCMVWHGCAVGAHKCACADVCRIFAKPFGNFPQTFDVCRTLPNLNLVRVRACVSFTLPPRVGFQLLDLVCPAQCFIEFVNIFLVFFNRDKQTRWKKKMHNLHAPEGLIRFPSRIE